MSYHQNTIQEVIDKFNTSLSEGLTTQKVKAAQEKYGLNELEKEESESLFEKIKQQFEDILVRLLLIAAVISFLASIFGKKDEHSIPPWVEPCVIFAILIGNACVGIYQDYDAQKAIEALKDLQSTNALCLRNSEWKEVNSKEIVPGDIIQINPGNKVPADIRLATLKTISLRINQSLLTGEVFPVQKQVEPIKLEEAGIQDKLNYLYSGTLVANGSGTGVVVNTGMNTEMGKIQLQVIDAKDKDDKTPLKKKLDEFGDLLAKVIGVICLVIWLINIPNFFDPAYGNAFQGALYYFKIAVALAVAAIPEGLPAVVTTCLALGTRRMAKQNAIVRRLLSVETLGCTTIICSDKTGTLTSNEMSVKNIVLPNELLEYQNFEVEGHSYRPEGKINGIESYIGQKFPQNLKMLTECMSICNESKLFFDEIKQRPTPSGLPTEAALKVLVEKLGNYDPEYKEGLNRSLSKIEQYNEIVQMNYTTLATLEFSRDRKSMSVLAKNKNSANNILFIKGAPDYLVKNSSKVVGKDGKLHELDAQAKSNIIKEVSDLASKGLRCLAIAYKTDLGELNDYNGKGHQAHKTLEDYEKHAEIENNSIFIGFVAMQDPPRPGVNKSIEICKRAGISVIMITGDIKETAQSIAKEIGIINDSEIAERSFSGMEYEKFDQNKQLQIISQVLKFPSGLVFSRTEPIHKRQLVQLLSKQNQIVAMTGDGVNDAPALKQAHIGIAMGISGTEVAKEASDMVLADDNFSTIVSAIEEGRTIFSNMKAFIRYMISSNIGEVVSIFMTSCLGIPDGFNSIQLLWVNLVTDGLPATALSFNPPDPDIMEKAPRKRYMIIGTYVGLATVFIFIYWFTLYSWSGDGHQLISFKQLSNWSECENWKGFTVKNFGKYDFSSNPCLYFSWGKQKASTLSLSVLVTIEMFNAINALSEDASLFTVGLLGNIWLLFAIAGSMILHSFILYIPFLARIFSTTPLSTYDWMLVVGFSFPVIIIDEFLKIFARKRNAELLRKRIKQD